MLAQAVESYLAVRRGCGFALKSEGNLLQSFATFSDAKGQPHVCAETAIEWAGLAESVHQRARRLGQVIRFTRYVRAEEPCHELPPAVFGSENRPRPVPYIFSQDNIQRLVHAAAQSGYRTLRRHTYSTLFALLACTGLRVVWSQYLWCGCAYGPCRSAGWLVETEVKAASNMPLTIGQLSMPCC